MFCHPTDQLLISVFLAFVNSQLSETSSKNTYRVSKACFVGFIGIRKKKYLDRILTTPPKGKIENDFFFFF